MDCAAVGAPFTVCCSSQHPSTRSAHHPAMPSCQYRKTVLVSASQTGSDFMLWGLLQLLCQSYFALNRVAVSVGWHINEVKALSVISYLVHKRTACTALLVKMKWEDWTSVNLLLHKKNDRKQSRITAISIKTILNAFKVVVVNWFCHFPFVKMWTKLIYFSKI